MISHEKLKVYQRSLELAELSMSVLKKLPKGNSELGNQLKRALFSVTLNISEGAGRIKADDKKHFYAIARGSAMEVSAIFDLLRIAEYVTENQYNEAKDRLLQIVRMLSSMVGTQSLQKEG